MNRELRINQIKKWCHCEPKFLRRGNLIDTQKRDCFAEPRNDNLYVGFILFLLSFFLFPLLTFAADYSLNDVDPLGPGKNPAIAGDPVNLAAFVINYVIGFLGAAIFGVFIYGGVVILFSRGEAKKIDKGKKTLAYAVIGLAIIFFSYAILNLIFNVLTDIKK